MTDPASQDIHVWPAFEIADRILRFVEDAYTTEVDRGDGARVAALPGRRYVAGGGPRDIAWDCDAGQVTVALDRLIYGTNPQAPPQMTRSPGRAPGHAALIRGAIYELQVVRAAPGLSETTGNIPSTQRVGLHGREFLRDAGFLSGALNRAVIAGALRGPEVDGVTPPPVTVQIGDMVGLGPQGYLAATATSITVTAT